MDDPLEAPFEVEEIAQVITQLPRCKAGGTDGGSALLIFLTNIFNVIRGSGQVVDNWTVGRNISLFKGGR